MFFLETNQYLDMFIDESKEHLQTMNDNLLQLEQNPDDIDVVKNVFRSAHTIKGMSATMGFEDIANLTHELENVLDLVRNEKLKITPEIMDVVFQSVDLLEGMVYSIIDGQDGSADIEYLVIQLKAIASGEPLTAVSESAKEVTKTSSVAGISELLDAYQVTIIKQSQSSGHNAFFISITLSPECMLRAARVFMIFGALENMGEVIQSIPVAEDLEDEKFDLDFQLVFLTKEDKETVRNKLLNITEVDKVDIDLINLDI